MNDTEREELRRRLFPPKQQESNNTATASFISPALLKLFPPERIARIKAKALRKYAAKQDAQYERWLQRVSE